MLRSTRTYAKLPVPALFYALVKAKLKAAGYDHAIHRDGQEEVLDMHGIALEATPDEDTGERISDAQLAAFADLAIAIDEASDGLNWNFGPAADEDITPERAREKLAALYTDAHRGPYQVVYYEKAGGETPIKIVAITGATEAGKANASWIAWAQPNNVKLLISEVMRERSARRGFSCGPLDINPPRDPVDLVDVEAAVQTAVAAALDAEPSAWSVGKAQEIARATVELLRKRQGESGIPEQTAEVVEHEGGDVDCEGDPKLH